MKTLQMQALYSRNDPRVRNGKRQYTELTDSVFAEALLLHR